MQLELSETERKARARPWSQPEISLLRGQCLECETLYVDAAQTYHFIIARYPTSEYMLTGPRHGWKRCASMGARPPMRGLTRRFCDRRSYPDLSKTDGWLIS